MNRIKRLLLCLLLGICLCACSGQKADSIPEFSAAQVPAETEPPRESAPLIKNDMLVLASALEEYAVPADYYYNTKGQVVCKVLPDWDQITEYEYYEDGTLKRETVSREGVPAEYTEYDEKGNPIACYSITQDDSSRLWKCSYTYDNSGRLLISEKLWDSHDLESPSVMCERTSYTYHDDGSWDKEYSDCYITENGEIPHCHSKESYTPEGRLWKAVSDLDDMAPFSSITVYTFDKYGNTLTQTWDYEYEGTVQKQEYLYTHTYDADGVLLHTEVSRYSLLSWSDGSEEVPMSLWYVADWEYNDAGAPVRKAALYPSMNESEETLWEYDDQGNLVRFYGPPVEFAAQSVERIYRYKLLSQVQYTG